MSTIYSTSHYRSTFIQDFCQSRGISTLTHFTRLENLKSIIHHGLLSRNVLQRQNIRAVFNDSERFDGQLNATCLSISFPNYKMFYRYRTRTSNAWIVLELDARLLWENDCAFCVDNAASNFIRRIPLTDRKMVESLEGMFSDCTNDQVQIFRSNLFLPKNYPTNPQAEVLAFDSIPMNAIRSILVNNLADAKQVMELLGNKHQNMVTIKPSYFSARGDYQHWSTIKKDKQVPTHNTLDDDLPF